MSVVIENKLTITVTDEANRVHPIKITPQVHDDLVEIQQGNQTIWVPKDLMSEFRGAITHVTPKTPITRGRARMEE